MSFLKTEKVLGYCVVEFSGGDEYESIGWLREDGAFSAAIAGFTREGDYYTTIEVPNGMKYHIPHMAVDLILEFESKDSMDDWLLHAELQAMKGESESDD